MKKKITAAALSSVMLIPALTGVYPAYSILPAFSADSSKISGDLSELMNHSADEYFPVWLFLDDKGAPDFDLLTEEKINPMTEEEMEAYFELSEAERTDLIRETRGEFVKEYYKAKNNDFITSFGIDESNVGFVSMFTPVLICKLTAGQIQQAAEDERVESITLFTDFTLSPQTESLGSDLTKEAFLSLVVSDDEDFSDGGFVYGKDLKYDAFLDEDGCYQLIIYGVKEEDYRPAEKISEQVMKLNTKGYLLPPIDIGFWTGYKFDISPNAGGSPAYSGRFSYLVYAENVMPGIVQASSIVKASVDMPYDIAQYIFPTITPGDLDNDGLVTAADASLILEAYSYLSTGTQLTLNMTMCDINGDGQTDSADASDILVKYAEASTGTVPPSATE